jgi:DNA primase catalytic core
MARIPEAELERLKSEVSVERLVEGSGVELRRAGKDLLGRCPFHDDAEASLVVTPAKNLWHCFGCQFGGGPIDWVMKSQGVSFRHAVQILREGQPLAAGKPVKQSTVPKLPPPVAFDADDQQLLNQVIGYYHETLKQSPEVLAYLESRGIRSAEATERFRLGFANRTLGLRLPESNRKTGAEMRERLTRIGILRQSGHEHFNGSLVIPVIDEAGNVTEVYGRKLLNHLRPGTAYHLYLPGPHRGVWNVEALAASKEVLLCEALIDALSFWCAGYRNVTAAYGVEGFTEDHLAAFKRYGTERVLVAYDRDDAGDRAADKLAARLMAEGIECWRVQFPHGMDANEYALKVQPAPKSLGLVIRKALWMGKGQAPERAFASEIDPTPIAAEPGRSVAPEPVTSLAAKEESPPASPPDLLPASPVPPAPALAIEAEVKEQEVVLGFGDRRYRVRGLAKNLSFELLKVNLLVSRGERFYVDTLDLYSAKHRAAFITQAALELGVTDDVLKHDLGRVLLKLENLQEQEIRKALAPKAPELPQMTEPEREAALELLRSPHLVERILTDLEACGLVGERTNKLVGYLAAISRKCDAPLAVLVQSSSAAGKSSLMEAILALAPDEDRVKYSAMTGQSLFYMGQHDLRHKILAIAEESGAQHAAYALKLLQSEGELTIASTGKDPATGNLVTQEYRVEGPVMLFTTTAAAEIDDELKNRCLVLAVDESREQTRAIHALQRDKRTLEGLLRKKAKQRLVRLHQNAQRLLRPLEVLNPYAAALTFPDQATRTRRDHEKYLTLIDAIALLHQHQRPVKTATRAGETVEYLEVELADIALANELAHEVLGRSLDELPPQTRRLLRLIDEHVGAECVRQAIERNAYRFSRRELREALGLGDTQLKLHLARLVELEYVIPHRRGTKIEYELVYDGKGQDGRPFVPGLIDLEGLRAIATTAHRSGANADRSAFNELRSGQGRGPVGPRSGGGRAAEIALSPEHESASGDSIAVSAETHLSDDEASESSYPHLPLAAAAR